MSFNKLDSTNKLVIVVIFLLIVIVNSQLAQDKARRLRVYNATYNEYIQPLAINGENVKKFTFGFNEVTADYYWLKLIQYYGGGDPNGKYTQLPKLYNTITELSPKFISAYENGLLVLGSEGYADDAIKLGEKGARNLPESWQIPYYTGLVEHIYKKNYKNAAVLFDKSSKMPNAPENTKYFSAIYYSQANELDVAYALFQTIYENSTDQSIKERSGKYLVYLQNIKLLNSSLKTYFNEFGKYPTSLKELVSAKIIKEIPANPLEFDYNYNSKTGLVTTSKSL